MTLPSSSASGAVQSLERLIVSNETRCVPRAGYCRSARVSDAGSAGAQLAGGGRRRDRVDRLALHVGLVDRAELSKLSADLRLHFSEWGGELAGYRMDRLPDALTWYFL